ncbi:MAG: hypothetical protein HC771_08725 [Synechococcales cyanobacterium CRU_2_2]|nr:hypothetical protein [Synechococcales cyanobacterium CRU_2_2]
MQSLQAMRIKYQAARQQLSDPALSELNAAYSPALFELSDREWGQLKESTRQILDNILIQGIAPGVPQAGIDRAINLHVGLLMAPDESSTNAQALSTQILSKVVKANLQPDLLQTQQKAERAAQAVEVQMVSIRKGESIVRAGEKITQEQLVLLDRFGQSRRGPNWRALGRLGGLIAVEVGIFLLVQRRILPRMRRRDLAVILILALSTPLMFLLRLPSSNLPAVALLMGSFYGSPLGVLAVGLMATALPLGLDIDLQALMASIASGTVAAMMAGRLRAREELAILGLGVGLTQGLVHLMVALILSGTGGRFGTFSCAMPDSTP